MNHPRIKWGGAAAAALLLLVSSTAGAQYGTGAPMDTTVATGTVDSTVMPYPPAPILQLRASIAERKLYVIHGDTVLGEYQVAVGTDEHPTPTGGFTIRKIVWNPRWVPPDVDWARNATAKAPGDPTSPMQLVKIFFKEPDYYIHGTNRPESMGEAASHGCLRMVPEQAAEVAKLIMEHGGAPREENWFWRIIHFRSEEKTVYLDNPVPLTITD